MKIPAYDSIYLSKAARTMGNMLHDAVYVFDQDGNQFLQKFIQSDIAEQIEDGNPKYVAGRSGMELFVEVEERTTGKVVQPLLIETYDRSDAYWIGWALAHYQWYTGRRFKDVLEVVPYREWAGLYKTLHEADIRKVYEVIDAHMEAADSKLKQLRKRCGLTQEELAELSCVSLNTIRAYERRAKDIGKAQVDILMKLAAALKCEIADLIE